MICISSYIYTYVETCLLGGEMPVEREVPVVEVGRGEGDEAACT